MSLSDALQNTLTEDLQTSQSVMHYSSMFASLGLCRAESYSDVSGINLHQKCLTSSLLLLLHARITAAFHIYTFMFIFS